MTKEKAPLPVVDGASSENETLGQKHLSTENIITPRELCRACGERLRLDEKDLCPDCKKWQPLLDWARPQK